MHTSTSRALTSFFAKVHFLCWLLVKSVSYLFLCSFPFVYLVDNQFYKFMIYLKEMSRLNCLILFNNDTYMEHGVNLAKLSLLIFIHALLSVVFFLSKHYRALFTVEIFIDCIDTIKNLKLICSYHVYL